MLQLVHDHMTGQVIHSVDRDAQGDRKRLRRGDSHEQGAHQSGARGHGESIEIRKGDAGVVARPLQCGLDRLEVGAARHFWHHPAESGVLLDAGCDLVGQELASPHDADPGLVARRLDAENERLREPTDVTHVRQRATCPASGERSGSSRPGGPRHLTARGGG